MPFLFLIVDPKFNYKILVKKSKKLTMDSTTIAATEDFTVDRSIAGLASTLDVIAADDRRSDLEFEESSFLYMGRLLEGFGVGIISYMVPVYIAEIAPQNMRGALGAVNQLSVIIGILLAYVWEFSLTGALAVVDLSQDTGMLGCRPASSPMDPNIKLSTDMGELLPDPSVYQRLVGRLIYLTNTRPDLTFAVSIVSQFMHSPRSSHLDAVYHILRYLKSCPGLGLFFKAGALLQAFVLFEVVTSYHGKVKSRLSYLVLLPKLNTGLWHRVLRVTMASRRNLIIIIL